MGVGREQRQSLLVRAAIALGAIALAGPCPAAQDPQNDLVSLVELLDSPDLLSREQAQMRLARRADFGLAEIEQLLRERDALSPEQRMRLFAAGRAMFFRGPRAGMGIAFGDRVQRGMQINSTVAGFDAARVLRPDDVIASIGDRSVESREQVSAEILSREPGESMDLLVVRDGRELEVSLAMGSYDDLNSGRSRPIETEMLERAWSIRLARNGIYDPMGVEPASAPGIETIASSLPLIFNQRGPHTMIEPAAPTMESWLVNDKREIASGGGPRGGVDRFAQPRTRIGMADASLPAVEATAQVLEEGRGEEKYALMIEGLLMAQRALSNLERQLQSRLQANREDPQQRAALAETERSVTLAARKLGEWYRAWEDAANAGVLDE